MSHHVRRLIGVIALATTVHSPPAAHAEAEVYIGTSTTPMASLPAAIVQPRQPVLFVHGHNTDDENDADFNYRKNFHDDPSGALTSFQVTIDDPVNAWLGIEPYYIRFQDQRHSIVNDAQDIADAVERILHRHDPAHTPGMASPMTPVRVALIAYSKGTISSRLYLKSLHEQLDDMPAPRAGFNPVNVFVAVSPPNHGIAFPLNPLQTDRISSWELNNGYGGTTCAAHPLLSEPRDFIAELNGHPIGDTESTPFANPALHHREAPGSRPNGAPEAAGTLYLCLYADSPGGAARDFVGGDGPSDDCQGRKVARNLAPDAVNTEVDAIPGGNEITVHQNTVHTPEVICHALATVVHGRAPAADMACTLVGDIPRIPPRTAVELVLDVSGSMLTPVAPGSSTSRLLALQQSVEIFLQLYGVFAGPADRIGVTYFGSTATPLLHDGAPIAGVSDDAIAAFVDHVNAYQTSIGQLTAMGSGLRDAIGVLESTGLDAGVGRHVILFTDGMQNVSPRVSDPPPPLSIPGSPPITLDDALGVRVHTIGIGAAALTDILEVIATKTLATNYLTLAADEDLTEFFVNSLVESLRGNSPQLVAYRRGALSSTAAEETFAVGGDARRLVVMVRHDPRLRPQLQVFRDGVDVGGQGRVIQGTFYRLFVIERPLPGTWTARLAATDKPGGYELATIVDEPRLEVEPWLERSRVRAGAPIDLRVRVQRDGRPIGGSTNVSATVYRPNESFGTVLATVAAPPTGAALADSTPAQEKLERLLARPVDRARLHGRSSETIELIDVAGDGIFSARIGGTERAGAYRVEIDVHHTGGDGTAIERHMTRTATVAFGPLDVASTTLRASAAAQDAGTELTVRPRDRSGNHLGPGWSRDIVVTTSAGSPASVRDALDGSYVVMIAHDDADDPSVTVAVGGDLVHDGPLSGVPDVDGRSVMPRWAIVLLAVVLLLIAVIIARRVT